MAKQQQVQQAQQQQPDQHVEQMKAMGVSQDKIEEAQQQLKQRGLNFSSLIQTIIKNLPALLVLLDELKNAAGGSGGQSAQPTE